MAAYPERSVVAEGRHVSTLDDLCSPLAVSPALAGLPRYLKPQKTRHPQPDVYCIVLTHADTLLEGVMMVYWGPLCLVLSATMFDEHDSSCLFK